MPLSLLTLLAARACHADTLKRALDNTTNEESDIARRLLARLGIGPTHLDDMRRGSAERLRAAKSAPTDIRTQAAFEQQLAEADEHVRVLDAKLRAACTMLDVPVTTDLAAVVRALLSSHHDLDGRMEQVRNLLRVHDNDNDDVPDAIRALQAKAAQTPPEPPEAHEQDGMKPKHRLARIRRMFHFSDETLERDLAHLKDERVAFEDLLHETASLLGVDDEDYEGVPIALRALLNRAESAEAAPTPDTIADLLALPDYVRIEVWPVGDSFNARAVRQADGAVNAASNTPREALIALYNHITERVKPKAAKSPEHDPLADITILTGLPVRVVHQPTAPEEFRFSAHIDGYEGRAGATVRDAALALRDHVKALMPKPNATKPPEPIVLGPWRALQSDGPVWYRQIVGIQNQDGLQVGTDGWAVFNRMGCHLFGGDETGEEGKAAADKWARENGYVLLDAEPGSCKATLHPWWESCHGETRISKHAEPRPKYVYLVLLSDKGHWEISGGPPQRLFAHGPQTGEEGKRYADAAAHALGLTGGGE